MTGGMTEAVAFATDLRPSVAVRDRPTWRKWAKRTLLALASICFVFYASMWWSTRLTTEERAYKGKWQTYDSFTVNSPSGIQTQRCLRELELMQGQEVRLKVWNTGNGIDPKILLAFGGMEARLFPLRMSGVVPVMESPPPETISQDALISPPSGVATGRWRIENGQIRIEWDSRRSTWNRIQEPIDKVLYRRGTISMTPQGTTGTITRDGEDRFVIRWIREPSALTGYYPPPQTWTRRAD